MLPDYSRAWGRPILFPANQWGQAYLALPQSSEHHESLFNKYSDNFEPISAFSIDNPYRKIASGVGRLDILKRNRNGEEGITTCTAWLISSNYIITNNHCIPGDKGDTILDAEIRFGLLKYGDEEGEPFQVDIEPIETDRELDYSILEVIGNPALSYQVIPLNFSDPKKGEELFIIHHPLAKPQRLTRKDCRTAKAKHLSDYDIRHLCDTLPGSSGAPVLSDITKNVVGIHYRGGLDRTAGSYNSAKRLKQILNDSYTLGAIASIRKSPGPKKKAIRGEDSVIDLDAFKKPKPEKLDEKDTQHNEIARDGQFIAYSDGIVKDTKTGLEWIAGPNKEITMDEAKAWVNSLTIGGGWRIPTKNELLTLFIEGKGKYNRTELFSTIGWSVFCYIPEESSSLYHFQWFGPSYEKTFSSAAHLFKAWVLAVRSRKAG